MRVIYIGRDSANDIVIRHPTVSGRHAKVTVLDDHQIWIEDLGSRNGTFVGNPPQSVSKARINLDDTITLGDAVVPENALKETLARTQPQIPSDRVIHLKESSSVTFGRAKDAGVLIDQPLASAKHASVRLRSGRVIVTDLGSMSGTFVDDHRIDVPTELKPGVLLQIADQVYRLSTDGRALEPVKPNAYDIDASNLAVDVAGKRLLEGVSLVVQPGELVAIMGPSGAGKSVLLSVLNGQIKPSAGQILISGHDLVEYFDLFRGKIGYVPQDDILHADLTVWQALWYAARLRLPKDMGDEEISNRIRNVLSQLGLEGTEQERIGDQRKRGISGGQRKRVNLAMELLTDPPILILDEPTSGLSSTDTISVVELLRTLADSGKTILVAIHQPSLEVFQKFDAVAVIARDVSTDQVGRLAWFGRAWPDAVNFFEPSRPGMGLPRSAEGLLRGLSAKPVAEWVNAWEKSETKSIWVDRRTMPHPKLPIHHDQPKPQPIALFSQWYTLVRRSLSIKAADRWSTLILFLQAPLVGLLIGAVFSRVLRSTPANGDEWLEVSINLATTMFVTALAAIYFGCSSTAREIVNELPVYRRERMVGLSIFAYLCSKVTLLVAISSIQCALLLGVVYWFCGLQSSWWDLYSVLFASGLAGGAMGLLISATFRTVEAAAGILPLLLLPMIVLGGILVKLKDLPTPTRPLAASMPSRWAFEGLMLPEARAQEKLRVNRKRKKAASGEITSLQNLVPLHGQLLPFTAMGCLTGTTHLSLLVATLVPYTFFTSEEVFEDGQQQGGPLPDRRFILPGRQRIYDGLRKAAEVADQEIRRAKEMVENKAREYQGQMRTEIENRAVELQKKMESESATRLKEAEENFKKLSKEAESKTRAEFEKRLKDAQDDFEKRSKDAEIKTRAEFEKRLKGAQDDFEKQSKQAETKTRAEFDKRLKDAQDDFEKRSKDGEGKVREQLEKKLQEARNDFEKKASDAEIRSKDQIDKANAAIEEKFRELKRELQKEIDASKGEIIPQEKVTPDPGKTNPPTKANEAEEFETLDMADPFFGQGSWRSPDSLPLSVLSGMFLAGIIASGMVLHFRDPSRQ